MLFKKKVQILAAFVCFVLCFAVTLQYKSVTKNNSLQSDRAKRNDDLQNQLINANKEIIDLKLENMQLTTDIEAYRSEAAKSSDGSNALKKELDNARMMAGLTDVSGSGVTVTIADSKAPSPSDEDNSAYIVHDSDLRDIVNELCAAGAEAVSINSERIVSTSSIRCVGNTILVNNKRCAPPFEIKAIGDSSTLESGLNIRGGVIDVLRLYKIEVNVTKMSKINIGKFGGTLSFRHAETVTE